MSLAPLIGLDTGLNNSKFAISFEPFTILLNLDKITDDYRKYAWYLKIILKAKLPKGYIRETTPSGHVVYYNEAKNQTSEKHPLATFFRKTFAKVLMGHISYRDYDQLEHVWLIMVVYV